jgi:hypothetical protein
MDLRVLRTWVGLVLGVSGAVMSAASWERWTRWCLSGADEPLRGCAGREDNLYHFLPPAESWEPVGSSAELGGLSLLVLALAVPLLPWAMTGRRPGVYSAVALVVAELAVVSVGVATLRSGLSGEVVDPWLGGWSTWAWLLLLPSLVVRFLVDAAGWARAACVALVLSTPLVALFSYANGDYDARPWWEAWSGVFMATAGLCLVVAAAWPSRTVAGRGRPVQVAARS